LRNILIEVFFFLQSFFVRFFEQNLPLSKNVPCSRFAPLLEYHAVYCSKKGAFGLKELGEIDSTEKIASKGD
jgi:hypothetical protein